MTEFFDLVYVILDIITAFYVGSRIDVKSQPGITLAKIQYVLDHEQRDVLEFTQEGTVIVIRRKQYLERDTWLAINAKVDELGGRWVSAGQNSRWEMSITR